MAIDLLKKTHGNIIFISSIAGCETLGAPIAYSCAKTALLAYSKNLANELGKYKIRVNSISPGNVLFDNSTWSEKIKNDKQKVLTYISSNVPLNEFATPEDIAKAVIFLEQCTFVAGSNIVVDGGQIHKII
jgi:3-oxoacyl-[acyl-carrier protein] reductase